MDDNADDFMGAPAPDGFDDKTNAGAATAAPEMPQAEAALLEKIAKRIKSDKAFHRPAFKKMREDMDFARNGHGKDWPAGHYVANVAGRFIKQKVGALYAKNPRIVATRRETLDFAVWDEDQQSLMLAMQTIQTGMQQSALAMQGQAQTVDPTTGIQTPPARPELPQGFQEAQELVADFRQGIARRKQAKMLGRTLEILFNQSMRQQKPLDFKMAMKRVVRRACTAGVAYVEVGYQEEFGPRAGVEAQLADARGRLQHLETMQREVAEGEVDPDAAEMAELRAAIDALAQEPEVVLREGLVFDYPPSTRVIPDKQCTSLVGFVGANHLTVEYPYTKSAVESMFRVKLEKYTHHKRDDKSREDASVAPDADSASYDTPGCVPDDLALVWKHYDKETGLVYYLCDGFDQWLRPPEPPPVYVSDFWPVYAVTFNDVEHETEIFPPSDVRMLLHMANEYNRSRQGLREHRKFARPRMAYANGTLDDPDIEKLKSAEPFDAIGLNLPADTDINKILMPIKVAGVDPNLYDTNQVMTDMQVVVGTSDAQLGATTKATATESAIASGAAAKTDSSSVDDLDEFLSCVARGGGQILLKKTPLEKVKRDVGPGAVWLEQSAEDIADELFLEIEAGSSGKPNQAIEIKNWQMMLPFLIQMPNISKMWLARETIRRLDDKADLTEAVAENVPSVVAQNGRDSAPPGPPPGAPGAAPQAGPPTGMPPGAPGAPGPSPAAQGHHGAANGPAPPAVQPVGSGPAFGSNQV